METASAYRICLFGPPDPADTVKLIREQFETERRRALERWGFDILDSKLVSPPKKRKTTKKKTREDKENTGIARQRNTPRKLSPEFREVGVLHDRSNINIIEDTVEITKEDNATDDEYCINKTPSKSGKDRSIRPSQTRVSGMESGVRRKLFPVAVTDPDCSLETEKKSIELLDEEKRIASVNYNFDFENEVPLEGKYQWEKVPLDNENKPVNNKAVETNDGDQIDAEQNVEIESNPSQQQVEEVDPEQIGEVVAEDENNTREEIMDSS